MSDKSTDVSHNSSSLLSGADPSKKREITYKSIKVSELPEFCDRFMADVTGQEILPITRQRASSQAKNPLADPNDLGLTLAYDGKKLVGFLGMVPGLVQFPLQTHKVYFASSLLISNQYRGYGIAQKLYETAFSAGQDVIGIEFTQAARALYVKLKAVPAGHFYYHQWELSRLDLLHSLFRVLRKIFDRISPLKSLSQSAMDFAQKVTVPFTKRIFYSFSKNKNTSRYRGVRLEQLAQLPSDLTEPRLASKTPFFVRGVSVVNWMVQNPWILENQPLSIPRYEFSESRPLFKYEVVQISRAGEPADYLVASISKLGNEIVLKVTDLFPQSKFSAEHFYLALLDLADRHQADVWTCVPQELEIFFSGAKLAQLKKSREYIFWSGQNGCMAKVHKDLQFAPGDGDAAFW